MILSLKCTEVFCTEQQADVRFSNQQGSSMHLRMKPDESKQFEPGQQVVVRITAQTEVLKTAGQ